MNKREILERAIRKAINNGWKEGNIFLGLINYKPPKSISEITMRTKYHQDDFIFDPEFAGSTSLLFNHNFAKAFWGKEKFKPGELIPCDDLLYANPKMFKWKYHLQQMVLEKDPIKYLEKFLDEK